MPRKSLRTILQITLLGVLLGTSSTAYADADTSIKFKNFSLSTPGNNVITFGEWQPTITGIAELEGVVVDETLNTLQLFVTTPRIPGAGVSFARGGGLIDTVNLLNLSGTALAPVFVNGCTCSGSALGQFVLSNTFIVTGGTGSVDVTLALTLETIQGLNLDQFDIFGSSQVMFELAVDGTTIFSYDNLISSSTPGSFTLVQLSEVLSRTLTLQFNTPHTITFTGTARSAASAEIPEPATLFLLVSGLGFMGGVVKKRRGTFSAR